jgi:hypothetical protein
MRLPASSPSVGRHESVSGTSVAPDVIVTAAHALRRSRHQADAARRVERLASLAGADGSTDLAVLRTDGTNAVPIESRDAAAVRTRHWVMAKSRATRRLRDRRSGLIARVGGAWQTWRGGGIDGCCGWTGALGADVAPDHRADGFAAAWYTGACAWFGIVVPTSTVNRVADELLARADHARLFRHRHGPVRCQPRS